MKRLTLLTTMMVLLVFSPEWFGQTPGTKSKPETKEEKPKEAPGKKEETPTAREEAGTKEAPPVKVEANSSSELAALQGAWIIADMMSDGKKAPDKMKLQFAQLRVVVSENKASMLVVAKNEVMKNMNITFTIDPTKTPKEIDIKVSSDKETHTLTGLYKLESTSFTLCFNSKNKGRPNKIESNANTTVLVMRQDKEPQAKILRGKQIVDFVDNTKKYKGETIKLRLAFDGVGSLRCDVPTIMPFDNADPVTVLNGPNFKMKILVLPGDDVPNAMGSDELWVTFICGEGDLMKGNKAIQIKR